MTALLWLRRDLRRRDHPALLAAAQGGRPVVVAFVLDPRLWEAAGPVRRAWLAATVLATAEAFRGSLVLAYGDPRTRIPELALAVGASEVHVTRETTPAGRRRDTAVSQALAGAGIRWVETGTPYAVGPGLVRTRSGGPYRVFTPFYRAWLDHGWPAPAESGSETIDFADSPSDPRAVDTVRAALDASGLPALPEAGESAALARWRAFRDGALAAYSTDRDRADLDGTSRISADLKVGALHPRTVLRDLAALAGPGPEAFRRELAWREFYADVLAHHPRSAWHDLSADLRELAYDGLPDAVQAWRVGRTGYPMVDAGMRQLAATGWMHNRVRMITASFLTKDLHAWWPIGARHFLGHLLDADVASNSHGWQWVAGTGTDSSPYFRVFNPVSQGERFDPHGDYVRRWVPELAHLPGRAVHRPWDAADGYAADYPARIVDHDVERREALARYAAARAHTTEETAHA